MATCSARNITNVKMLHWRRSTPVFAVHRAQGTATVLHSHDALERALHPIHPDATCMYAHPLYIGPILCIHRPSIIRTAVKIHSIYHSLDVRTIDTWILLCDSTMCWVLFNEIATAYNIMAFFIRVKGPAE